MKPVRSMLLALAGVALVVTTGCSAGSLANPVSLPATSSPRTTTAIPAVVPSATATAAPAPARVSFATVCPELIGHGQASVDLVEEFVADAQALADGGAATTARFTAVIDDFEYDVMVAPMALTPFITAQLTTMKNLRLYLMIGGAQTTNFREYRSAGLEIVNQCMPHL